MEGRTATHAGSWYSGNLSELSQQLDRWLSQVQGDVLPKENARVIIAPHAGYAYSGPNAAWAYKNLNVSKAKRVFLLGPTHHVYFKNCQLTKFKQYQTPLGSLPIDRATTEALLSTPASSTLREPFGTMTSTCDEDEHSLELHLPYIYKILSLVFGASPESFPQLVPILVGNTSPTAEREYGAILAPYLADPDNVFVVSSDFCHWGQRFSYTYYVSDLSRPESGDSLTSAWRQIPPEGGPAIHESIEAVDRACMAAVESGEHWKFTDLVATTGNTVCGRHPIGIIMAAMEVLNRQAETAGKKTNFEFVKYDQSSRCKQLRDSSVSYASAFAVLPEK